RFRNCAGGTTLTHSGSPSMPVLLPMAQAALRAQAGARRRPAARSAQAGARRRREERPVEARSPREAAWAAAAWAAVVRPPEARQAAVAQTEAEAAVAVT